MARIRRKHDKFTLKQARGQVMMNKQHTYRQRLRAWMRDPEWKNAPLLEGPSLPTEEEIGRLCAILGCTCPGCEAKRQAGREQAMIARHETEEYGRAALLDQALRRAGRCQRIECDAT